MSRAPLLALLLIACTPDYVPPRGTVEVEILYATTRERTGETDPERFYARARSDYQVGHATVRLPHDPRMGDRETGEPARVARLTSVEPTDALAPDVDAVVVFVPGFDVSFEGGARRAAQLAYDLELDGVVTLFSWPSVGGYGGDEVEVLRSAPHLRDLLEALCEQTDTVHVVAHGMGARTVSAALRALEHESSTAHLAQVVLVTPDMEADPFIHRIAPSVATRSDRLTVYVSRNERALAWDFDDNLLGDPDDGIALGEGFETVDASEVDTSLHGHAYHGDRRSVITDLRSLLAGTERDTLMEQHIGRVTYHSIEPAPMAPPPPSTGCSVSGTLGSR